MKKIMISFILGMLFTLSIVGVTMYSMHHKRIVFDSEYDNTSDMLSIMLQKEENSDEYEKALSNTWPKQDYMFNPYLSKCENGSSLSWKDNKIIVNTSTSDKCYVYFDKPKTYNFEFTGTPQEFSVPFDGTYKIELWGASGGNALGFRENYGGKGTYLKGNIELKKDNSLFIYVGGKGEDAKTFGTAGDGDNRLSNGGFNGGGDATGYGNCCGAGGGGATHIAFYAGLLKDFADKQGEILMAAAAGGGASRDFERNTFEGHGGSGGIYKGYDGNTAGNTQCLAYGATNNSGGHSCETVYEGLFGTGYIFDNENSIGVDGGGGGSGLYAGGSANCSGGGGGSSYVSSNYDIKDVVQIDGEGYQWLNIEKNNGIVGMPSPEGGNETGHTGDGYARITLISY